MVSTLNMPYLQPYAYQGKYFDCFYLNNSVFWYNFLCAWALLVIWKNCSNSYWFESNGGVRLVINTGAKKLIHFRFHFRNKMDLWKGYDRMKIKKIQKPTFGSRTISSSTQTMFGQNFWKDGATAIWVISIEILIFVDCTTRTAFERYNYSSFQKYSNQFEIIIPWIIIY